jgi:hypothetical protein
MTAHHPIAVTCPRLSGAETNRGSLPLMSSAFFQETSYVEHISIIDLAFDEGFREGF